MLFVAEMRVFIIKKYSEFEKIHEAMAEINKNVKAFARSQRRRRRAMTKPQRFL